MLLKWCGRVSLKSLQSFWNEERFQRSISNHDNKAEDFEMKINHRSCQFKQFRIKPEKKQNKKDFWGLNVNWKGDLCFCASVLYQLSYEDQYIGCRPIYWVHLNPWKEWNIEWNDGTAEIQMKWRRDHRSCYRNLRNWAFRRALQREHRGMLYY